ncbi:MAG: hypothetical protein LBL60_03200 [Mycoplasmataceae bacterium]|jgi:hypothetical protein|nr:hypothetical protein [Mycoplasmataceae bacterium]
MGYIHKINYELDFVTSFNSRVIVIEAKAGSNKSKSLNFICNNNPNFIGIKLSINNVDLNKNIINLPIYAIFMMPSVVKKYISMHT